MMTLSMWRRPAIWAVAALLPLAVSGPASAAERVLAGIKIFSATRPVLHKYGNPSQIVVGRPSLAPQGVAAGGSGSAGFGGSSGPGGGFGASQGAGGGKFGAFSGGGMQASTPGALPGMGGGGGIPSEFGGGGGAPSAFPGAGMGMGASASGSADQPIDNGEVTWIYDRPNGADLEFTMSNDGRVIQIRATGYVNPEIKTSRGAMLGQSYATIVGKYGYPESQEQLGTVLVARYTDNDHVAFEFYRGRLVAIIVAAVE